MLRRAVALVLAPLALAAAVACGSGDTPPLDPACIGPPDAIERALARAPAPVTVGSGTRLSQCIARARADADLESTGFTLTRAAGHLADRARGGDAQAALALGYLVGAARRGARRTAGIHAELARRLERDAAFMEDGPPDMARALHRGLRAGEATG